MDDRTRTVGHHTARRDAQRNHRRRQRTSRWHKKNRPHIEARRRMAARQQGKAYTLEQVQSNRSGWESSHARPVAPSGESRNVYNAVIHRSLSFQRKLESRKEATRYDWIETALVVRPAGIQDRDDGIPLISNDQTWATDNHRVEPLPPSVARFQNFPLVK